MRIIIIIKKKKDNLKNGNKSLKKNGEARLYFKITMWVKMVQIGSVFTGVLPGVNRTFSWVAPGIVW
jgi:hypothetical protein